eukprot:scaffold10110_cov69-Phaeocystis_antarctica.AAC.16
MVLTSTDMNGNARDCTVAGLMWWVWCATRPLDATSVASIARAHGASRPWKLAECRGEQCANARRTESVWNTPQTTQPQPAFRS